MLARPKLQDAETETLSEGINPMLARPKLQDAETETLSEGINPMLARPKSQTRLVSSPKVYQSHAREAEIRTASRRNPLGPSIPCSRARNVPAPVPDMPYGNQSHAREAEIVEERVRPVVQASIPCSRGSQGTHLLTCQKAPRPFGLSIHRTGEQGRLFA